MVQENQQKGTFIVFEGIDGSGKSTQIGLLKQRLQESGLRCYQTKEPTDGPVGALIRQILTGRMKADSRVIASLFAADRADHLLNEVDGILEKVEQGVTVLSDRYYFSSYAYHGVDMDMNWVIRTNEQNAALLRPTFTIFLDLPVETAMERIRKTRAHTELYEKEERLRKVRANYLSAFALLQKKERVLTLDASQPVDKLADAVWSAVSSELLL